MELLRQWAFGVCCAAVAGGITQMILPQSPLQKIYRVVAGAFFICCMVVPLFSVLPGVSMELEPFPQERTDRIAEDLSASMDSVLSAQVEAVLAGQTEEKLEKMGINGSTVHIYFSTEPEGTLRAEDVTVEIILPERYRYRHDELVKSLEYQLGLTVRMGYR